MDLRPLATLLAAASVAAALSGCAANEGDGDGHDHPREARPFTGQEDYVLEIKAGTPSEFRFDPDVLEVAAGRSVGIVFVNEGDVQHDVAIPSVGFHLTAAAGDEARGAFTAPTHDGEITCTIPGHAEMGMKGTLRIV